MWERELRHVYNSHCAAALDQLRHSKDDKDGHECQQFDNRTEDRSHQPPGKSSDRANRESTDRESLVAGTGSPYG